MTCQVADVNKPLYSVSKMCDAENVVAFTAEGSTINIVDGRANAFQKRSWSVCAEHVGKIGVACMC